MKKSFFLAVLLLSLSVMSQQYQVTITRNVNLLPGAIYKFQGPVQAASPNTVTSACQNVQWTLLPGFTSGCGNCSIFMSNQNYSTTTSPCPNALPAPVQVWNKLINTASTAGLPFGNYLTIPNFQYTSLDLLGKTFYYYTDFSDGYHYFITFGSANLSTPEFEKSFSVYPNPTRDAVNIDLESEVSGEVYNLTGNLVLNFTSNKVDLSALQPGVYLMKILSEGMQCTKKIVKQ
jgi:hypothetical protein